MRAAPRLRLPAAAPQRPGGGAAQLCPALAAASCRCAGRPSRARRWFWPPGAGPPSTIPFSGIAAAESPRLESTREEAERPRPGAPRGLRPTQGKEAPLVHGPGTPLDAQPLEPLPEPAAYDELNTEYELYPHTWEKAIQSGHAVPSDEFSRKNFILKAWETHPHMNLFVQIIVQALEEARAVDIVVIDVSNKWYFSPNHHDHYYNDAVGQRKIDMKIYCCGKTARHIELIAHAVVDKIRKGLVPGEFKRSNLTVDSTMEEVFWFVNVMCGPIVVEVMHPMRRDWRMRERRDTCLKVADANMFVEDMLQDGGWVRLWDHWTPVCPSMPETEYEYVYTQERSHGWERLDVLKPQYCVTLRDRQRREVDPTPLICDQIDLDNPSAGDIEWLRGQLRDRKVLLAGGGCIAVDPEAEADARARREAEIASGERVCNFEVEAEDPAGIAVSDEEVLSFLGRLRADRDARPALYESAEEAERKDKEWAEYSQRREARIRRFGYYDWIELQNDLQRNMVIMPDGPYSWDPRKTPDFVVEPHPENYRGKPRDTHWGPGWYDT